MIGIDPTTIRLADLEVLEAKPSMISPVPAASAKDALPPISKRDLRQQFVGVLRMINHLTGGDMRQQIDSVDFLVRRINQLEDEATEHLKDKQALIEKYEAEKAHYRQANQDEIAGYKKALRNIAAVIEVYSNPFDALPFSKWKNEAKGKWMLAVAESIKWAVQRAENQIDPVNAVPIAADEV